MSEIKRPLVAELERLATLKEKGIINNEELQNLKRQMLIEQKIVSLEKDKSEVDQIHSYSSSTEKFEPKKSKFDWQNIAIKYVAPFFSYFFSLFFILTSLGFFSVGNNGSGVCILVAGLLLLPPIYNLIKYSLKKIDFKYKRRLSGLIVLVLFITGVAVNKPSSDKIVVSQQIQSSKSQESSRSQMNHSNEEASKATRILGEQRSAAEVSAKRQVKEVRLKYLNEEADKLKERTLGIGGSMLDYELRLENKGGKLKDLKIGINIEPGTLSYYNTDGQVSYPKMKYNYQFGDGIDNGDFDIPISKFSDSNDQMFNPFTTKVKIVQLIYINQQGDSITRAYTYD